MPGYLDLGGWKRREHFHLFRGYDDPFFNLCADVDVTALHEKCRGGGPSFFLACLYLSLRAANEIEELRYRLRGDRVWVHDVVHGSSTVLRGDDTFGFGYFEYEADFRRFHERGRRELERARAGAGLDLRDRDDVIHYTVIPWVAFTSFDHARHRGGGESVPKLVFGKHFQAGGARKMPLSVEVHHALVDGLHVGRFFERFEALAAEPPTP